MIAADPICPGIGPWRSLVVDQGLTTDEAIDAAVRILETAAS